MDVREKLVELIFSSLCRHIHKSCKLAENIADDLITHGVTVQEWISVKDRLPEDGETVLVCGSRGGVYTAVLNKPGKYKGWHKLNSKSHYCDPTHWMPLPDAPQPPKGE